MPGRLSRAKQGRIRKAGTEDWFGALALGTDHKATIADPLVDDLRWKAENAIGIMFFQQVVGDLGTEVDRELYQKVILSQGWEAAAREFANKKRAKAQD